LALPVRSKGGFLNGVSGTLNSLTFKAGKTGKNGDREWRKYSVVALITPDGGKPTEQFLDAGFLPEGVNVSKDGRTLDGAAAIEFDEDTQVYKFLSSMIDKGFPEDRLGDFKNYDGVAGTRATFIRVVDEEATKKLGKRVGKPGTKSAGKQFDRDNLLVSEIISVPELKAAKGAKKPAAPKPAKPAAAPAASAPAPAAEAAADDNGAGTDDIVKAILAKAGGTIEFGKFGASAVRYGLDNKMDAKAYGALREEIISDAYLAGAVDRGILTVVGEGKDRVLVAA
jgi:hypothetical protein